MFTTNGLQWRGRAASAAATSDHDFATRIQTGYALSRTAVTNADPNNQNLGLLATGLMKMTVVSGVATVSTAVGGTDFPDINAYYLVATATPAAGPNQVNLGALTSGVPLYSVSGGVASITTFAAVNGQVPYGAASGGGFAQSANLSFDPINNRFGVGTNAAAQGIQVVTTTQNYQVRVGTAANYYDFGRDTVGSLMQFYGSQAGNTGYSFGGVDGTRMVIDTAGNVGINIASSIARKLHINGGTDDYQIRTGTTANYYDIGRHTATSLMTFYGNQSANNGYRFGGVDGTWLDINATPGSTAGYVDVKSLGAGGIVYAAPTTGRLATGTVTTGLSFSGGTLSLANTAVTPGSYTYTNLTVDAQGRITAASSGTAPVTSISPGTNVTVSGTGTVTVNALTGLTTGSIPFVTAGSVIGENNAHLFWKDATTYLGLGTTNPQQKLQVATTTQNYQMRLGTTANWYDVGRDTVGSLFRIYGSQTGNNGFQVTGVDGDRLTVSTTGTVTINDLAGGSQALVYATTAGLLARVTLSGLTLSSGTLSVTSPGITQLTGDVTAGPGSGSQAATIAANAVTDAKLRQGGARSVIGRSASTTGNVADIAAVSGSDSALRESSGTIGWGTLATNAYGNGTVTYAKFQSTSAASVLIGRGSGSGSGSVQEITLGGNLTLTGTVLDAATTGITQLTGDVLAGPGTGSQAATIRAGGARTVIGRSASTSGAVADIGAVSGSDTALRESSGTIGFGQLATAAYSNGSVTYAKFQSTAAASVLIGRGAGSGSGSVQEIALGTNLSMSGTTLNVAASGINQLTGDVTAGPGTGSVAATIAANAVTDAKLRQGGARTVIGRSASTTGNVADIGAVNGSDTALRESGGTIGFGQLATAAYGNGTVTYAKVQSTAAASVLIGRGAGSGSGSVQELTVNTPLAITGTTLIHNTSGVSPGTYSSVTVDATGHVTAGSTAAQVGASQSGRVNRTMSTSDTITLTPASADCAVDAGRFYNRVATTTVNLYVYTNSLTITGGGNLQFKFETTSGATTLLNVATGTSFSASSSGSVSISVGAGSAWWVTMTTPLGSSAAMDFTWIVYLD